MRGLSIFFVLLAFSLADSSYHEYFDENCLYKNDFVFDHMVSRPMTKDEQIRMQLWREESHVYGIASVLLLDEIGLGRPRLPCFCDRCN